MSSEMAVCAYKPCSKWFSKVTHNQKYDNEECCRLATNARIMEKYYERKARLKGAVRICKTPDCKTKLSRYNSSNVCSACERKDQERDRENLLRMLQ